jgi:hypothetical protein
MLLTAARATSLKDALVKQWKKNLQKFGVAYPEGAHKPALLALFEVMPKPLSTGLAGRGPVMGMKRN